MKKKQTTEDKIQLSKKLYKIVEELIKNISEPIKLSRAETIIDVKKFMEAQYAGIKHHHPSSKVWKAAYMRLYRLRNVLQQK